MKFIEPNVEYWEQPSGIDGIWSQIARATRVCYQSQVRKGESNKDFVNRVILMPARTYQIPHTDGSHIEDWIYNFDKMHGGMLEHGTVYLYLPSDYNLPDYFEITRSHYNKTTYDADNNALVTSNMRYIIENNKLGILKKYGCAVPSLSHPRRYTFSVTTDIGVSREGNRHRASMSIAEESTRYCAYNKSKFGGEINYARPAWLNADDKTVSMYNSMSKEQQYKLFQIWCQSMAEGDLHTWNAESYYRFGLMAAEFAYMGMRDNGDTTEKSRQVLNLNTKTQVVYTAFEDDWNHFIRLRADNISGKVHPNMLLIANKIKDELKRINNQKHNQIL